MEMMNFYLKTMVSISILVLSLTGCGQPVAPSEQLKYVDVIEHNQNSSKAFEASKMWLANTFNDSKSVIEYTNKENGTIIGKGILRNVYYGTMVQMDTRFTLKIEVKDNKSRLTFKDMAQYPSTKGFQEFNMWNFDALEKFKVRAKPLIIDYKKYFNRKSDSW